MPNQHGNNPVNHNLGMVLKTIYALCGLLMGAGCVILGALLCWGGLDGHTSIVASKMGFKVELNDVTPGIIFLLVGAAFVWLSVFKVKQSYKSTTITIPQATAPGRGGGGGAGGDLRYSFDEEAKWLSPKERAQAKIEESTINYDHVDPRKGNGGDLM